MGCGVFLTHSRDRDSMFFIDAWSIPVACTTDVVRIHGGFATFDCLIKQPFEITSFTMQVLIIEETQLKQLLYPASRHIYLKGIDYTFTMLL